MRKSVLQPTTRKWKIKFYGCNFFEIFQGWTVRGFLKNYSALSQKNRRTMRSTMSTFKTRQSSAGGFSRSSIGVRYSMGGKASIGPDSTIKTDKRKLHTNKDPRKLSEKAYVLLFTFLLSSSQRQSGQFFFSGARESCAARSVVFYKRLDMVKVWRSRS